MNIEPIQNSIVDQLQGQFTASSLTFKALNLPDNEADYRRAVGNGIVFIAYSGSTTEGVNNTDPVTQYRKLQFHAECFSRTLYGDTGLFAMRDVVEKTLIGFKPLNAERLYLVKDDITRGEDTIWGHIFQFECMTMLVQDSLSETILGNQYKNLID